MKNNLERFVKSNIHWLGHASFMFDFGEKRVYVDPFKITASLAPADYIFITHSHWDHFNPESISKITDSKTRLFGPKDVVAGPREPFGEAIRISQSLDFGSFSVKAVMAYNTNKFRPEGRVYHPPNEGQGYFFMTSAGLSIYHAGDTDIIPEMQAISPDIAILPIGGKYTMNVEEAAKAAEVMRAKLVIPMHYGTQTDKEMIGSPNDGCLFKERLAGREIDVVIMDKYLGPHSKDGVDYL